MANLKKGLILPFFILMGQEPSRAHHGPYVAMAAFLKQVIDGWYCQLNVKKALLEESAQVTVFWGSYIGWK